MTRSCQIISCFAKSVTAMPNGLIFAVQNAENRFNCRLVRANVIGGSVGTSCDVRRSFHQSGRQVVAERIFLLREAAWYGVTRTQGGDDSHPISMSVSRERGTVTNRQRCRQRQCLADHAPSARILDYALSVPDVGLTLGGLRCRCRSPNGRSSGLG